jgi:hypothetical protein
MLTSAKQRIREKLDASGIVIPYASRDPKMRRIADFGSIDGDWTAYSTFTKWKKYIVSVWIPSQPDSELLNRLFIECEWDTRSFLWVVQNAGLEEDVDRVASSGMVDLDPLEEDNESMIEVK